MTRLSIALAVLLATAGAWGATVTPFPDNPNAVLIVADGTAYLVVDGQPIVSWVIGEVPTPVPPVPPVPTPSKVSGVLIIEEQADRTVEQAKVLDDPVWQSLCLSKGLSFLTMDDDHPKVDKAALAAVAASKLPLPVVCLTDSGGKVLEVRSLPTTVEAMRELIGGVK